MEDDADRPKDEYIHHYTSTKVEAKKIISSSRFEDITAKYWQLVRNEPGVVIHKASISKQAYVQFMKRVYKVLLPLYREAEMSKEIDQEWLQDSYNLGEMTYNLFSKLLFRIAHQWATHIDIDEYLELLTKIYQRITMRKVIRACDGAAILCYPTLHVEIIPEMPEGEEGYAEIGMSADSALLEPCLSDEEEKDGYDYVYVENEQTMTVRKNKKRSGGPPKETQASVDDIDNEPSFSAKDVIIYKENVVYYMNSGDYKPRSDDFVTFCFAKIEDILPFGYPLEQFLAWVKNDVASKLEEARTARKEALAKMKREVLETGGAIRETQLKKEEDGGLVTEFGIILQKQFPILTSSKSARVRAKAQVLDKLYNSVRTVMKDAHTLSARLHMVHPKPLIRSGQTKIRPPVGGVEPSIEINKFGYNPALQRRLRYKHVPLFSQSKTPQFVNINYMCDLPDFQTAYRCDVERVENSTKLANPPTEEYLREEDFLAVESTYKKMRQIMLVKKFETIYTETLNADENDMKRVDKVVEREEQRRKHVRTAEPLNTKGVGETYEEKYLIKIMKGPFFQYASQTGIKEDDFSRCAQRDLIDYAGSQALRVLLLGKPRSGKTTLAKRLCARMDMLHVNVENWLVALQAKVKAYEPPEVEEGQEPPKWLSDLEESVLELLKSGQGPTHSMNVAILRDQMKSAAARTKGYVLDLTYYKGPESWAKIIRGAELLGPPNAAGRQAEWSHVIELEVDDAEAKLRAKHMRLDPSDGVVYSRWERAERNKPKPKKLDEDGNEIEEEEDENAPKPLDEMALVQRVQDTEQQIQDELVHYSTNERPALDDMLVRLFNSQYLKLDSAGLSPEQIADAAEWRLRPDDTIPLRPVPKRLEGASDFKGVLTDAFEDQPEGVEPLPRQWSLWRQQDPVALYNQKVSPGTAEFAVAYADSMFCFASEENMEAFRTDPKRYLQAPPKMPSSYRILMLGPKGIGAHTQAAKLHEQYGWKIVDYPQLVKSRLEAILKEEVHLPNNAVPGSSKVGLSHSEIDEIKLGRPFQAWRFIPWVLDHLGYELAKRPAAPEPEVPEGEPEELTEEAKVAQEKSKKKKEAEDAKKAKEGEEVRKAKEERRRKRDEARAAGQDLVALGLEESEEEEQKIEDLSIDDLVLKEDPHTGKPPFVGGFILLGFPQTELHATKLKEHGIEFDRILFLNDTTNEEEPGKDVKARQVLLGDLHYDWDVEAEKAQKVLAVAKEHLGEESVREIPAGGTPEEVAARIRLEIDPFAVRCDNPEDVRVSSELEEEAKRLPKGNFGDFCPVTFVKDGWLVKGSPEHEVTIYGKTHLLAGDAELALFKADPAKYLASDASLPLAPPPPKIMIIGVKGSGVTTQVRLLCEKFKLQDLKLKEAFLAMMRAEKEKRKRRRLLDRGFRPPLPAEEDAEGPPPDPEIEDDPEDFDKEAHERTLMKLITDASKGLVIDGSWTAFGEDSGVTAVDAAGFAGLLIESRRAPELVIMLKCEEASAFERMIDAAATKAEYERLMTARTDARKKQRALDRATKATELEEALAADEEKSPDEKAAEVAEAMAKWEEDRDAEEDAQDEEDPEKPNLEDMMNKQKEVITAQMETDVAFLQELADALKEKGIPVIDDIRTDTSAQFVFMKLADRLRAHFQMRTDFIERHQAQKLTPKELSNYELRSYIYQQSKFGRNSPIAPANPCKSREYAVLYRERIYYLSDEEEQKAFLLEPSKYTKGVEPVPLDLLIKPRALVLGLPKCGKSTLCQRVAQQTGAVHLQMHEIIERFVENDSNTCERLRSLMKEDGRGIDDQLMVSLLAKRLQAKDCLQNGYIIEDFPRTRAQAILMARSGVTPANVFHIRISHEEVYKRTADLKETDFGSNRTILSRRLRYLESHLPHVAGFYERVYNSLVEVDGFKSKWHVEDRVLAAVEASLSARQLFARSYWYRGLAEPDGDERPCELKDLHFDRALLKASLSQFAYHCPVTWKNTKQLYKCTHDPENCVFYKHVFYYFKGPAEKQMFLEAPMRFVNNVIFSSAKGIPIRLKPHKAAEVVAQEKGLLGHCPVTLVDDGAITKGDPLLTVQYKDQKFCFESEHKLQKFLSTPARYNKAELPVKMPPHEDPVTLYSLQGGEESTTFMEQALGSIVTRGLREVSENRLKYPNLSVKETMLKLFALYLKAENPANTQYMKEKYFERMKQFIDRCEIAEELSELAAEKEKKLKAGKWPEFKENYYNELGAKYDEAQELSRKEKSNGFQSYLC